MSWKGHFLDWCGQWTSHIEKSSVKYCSSGHLQKTVCSLWEWSSMLDCRSKICWIVVAGVDLSPSNELPRNRPSYGELQLLMNYKGLARECSAQDALFWRQGPLLLLTIVSKFDFGDSTAVPEKLELQDSWSFPLKRLTQIYFQLPRELPWQEGLKVHSQVQEDNW